MRNKIEVKPVVNSLLLLFLTYSSYCYSFDDLYESLSGLEFVDERGQVSNRIIANLPYSACQNDSPAVMLNDHCDRVSLHFGSRVFNGLYKNKNLLNYNFNSLSESQLRELVTNYKIASQDDNVVKWQVPTVSQLEWMYDNRYITPSTGQYYWAKNGADGLKKVFFNQKTSSPPSNAILARLANINTPDGCTEGIDCNSFNETKPFYLRASRSNAVHSMRYKIEAYDANGNLIPSYSTEAYTGKTKLYEFQPNVEKVKFLYCKKNTGGCFHAFDVPQPNWSYAKPTFCIYSKGTIFSTWIDWKQVPRPEDC